MEGIRRIPKKQASGKDGCKACIKACIKATSKKQVRTREQKDRINQAIRDRKALTAVYGPKEPPKCAKVIKASGVVRYVPKRTHIQNTYGLTEDMYYELLEQQNNSCGICGISEKEFIETYTGKRTLTKLFVDHDHTTNKVRGLLCDKCNRGIGLLGDTLKDVQNAVNYLTK